MAPQGYHNIHLLVRLIGQRKTIVQRGTFIVQSAETDAATIH